MTRFLPLALLLPLLAGCSSYLVTSSDDVGGVQPVRWGVVAVHGDSMDVDGRKVMADYCRPHSYRAIKSRRAFRDWDWWLEVRFECVDLSKPPPELPTLKL